MYLAVEKGKLEEVKLLIKYGAQIDVRNINGKSLLAAALDTQLPALIVALIPERLVEPYSDQWAFVR